MSVEPFLRDDEDYEFGENFENVNIYDGRRSEDPIEIVPLPQFGLKNTDPEFKIQDQSHETPFFGQNRSMHALRRNDVSDPQSFTSMLPSVTLCCGVFFLLTFGILVNPSLLFLGIVSNLTLQFIPSLVFFLCTGCFGILPCICFSIGWYSLYVSEERKEVLSGSLLVLTVTSLMCIIGYPILGLLCFLGSSTFIILLAILILAGALAFSSVYACTQQEI